MNDTMEEHVCVTHQPEEVEKDWKLVTKKRPGDWLLELDSDPGPLHEWLLAQEDFHRTGSLPKSFSNRFEDVQI